MNINDITRGIIGGGIKVHSFAGPGMLERVYEKCTAHELRRRGFKVEEQVAYPLVYEGLFLDVAYRVDLLVEDRVVVEIKAVETLLPVHTAQLLTYLRFSGKHLGLLMNFNEARLVDGIKRVIL